MADPYTINLEEISLDRFRQMLASKDLLPSRVMLLEQLDARFARIASAGITNLQQLSQSLKTKARLTQFAATSGIPTDYLTLLRREVNSYVSIPVDLDKLPGIDSSVLEHLSQAGVTTTKHLFARTLTAQQRADLSANTGIPPAIILELTQLSDLCRIIGIGPVSARLLLDAGIDSTAAFVALPPAILTDKLNGSIAANPQLVTNKVSENDLKYCLESANLLPHAVEYD